MRQDCRGIIKLIGLTYIPTIFLQCFAVNADANNNKSPTSQYSERVSIFRPFNPSGFDSYYDRFSKRDISNNAENNGAQRDIRSPLGTMRFGKRSNGSPLGTMRFGKRSDYYTNNSPLGTMRFGKRDSMSPLGTMRFGKRSGQLDYPSAGTMHFEKREPFDNRSPLGTMRFGKRDYGGFQPSAAMTFEKYENMYMP